MPPAKIWLKNKKYLILISAVKKSALFWKYENKIVFKYLIPYFDFQANIHLWNKWFFYCLTKWIQVHFIYFLILKFLRKYDLNRAYKAKFNNHKQNHAGCLTITQYQESSHPVKDTKVNLSWKAENVDSNCTSKNRSVDFCKTGRFSVKHGYA